METNVYPLDDGIGKVELIDTMGNDLTVVNAARVSLAKRSKELNDKDIKLIKYLAEHNHWTPFGHPQFQFRMKMPLFVIREWYRHTVGLVRNEESRRYIDTPPQFYLPKAWRLRAPSVKQGSSSETTEYTVAWHEYVELYNNMIQKGIAPEQARLVLPQNMYVEFIETGSLYAYARICNLRIAPEAMEECRKYAEAVSAYIANSSCSYSWEVLTANIDI